MRILYVYESLAIWGGIERILVDKMNYMATHYGDEVYIVTSEQGDHPVPYELDAKVHHEDLNVKMHKQYEYRFIHRFVVYCRLLRCYRQRLKDVITRVNPDLIVCTTAAPILMLLHLKGSRPLVVESHVNFPHADGLLKRMELRWSLHWISRADIIVTLTENDAENWRRISRHVRVIPNMVHLNNTGQYSQGNQKKAVFMGRYSRQKGLPDMIDIWALVNKLYPDWQLNLYGHGDEEDAIKTQVMKTGANVVVHGPTNDVFHQYIDSSLFLLTSVVEPFGLVIVEAMSCGLPVVAFDCPYGPATIIADGQDGFVVPERDKQRYAQRVCQLIENQSLRQQMGRQAIATSSRYAADAIMPQWRQLFESLVSS